MIGLYHIYLIHFISSGLIFYLCSEVFCRCWNLFCWLLDSVCKGRLCGCFTIFCLCIGNVVFFVMLVWGYFFVYLIGIFTSNDLRLRELASKQNI